MGDEKMKGRFVGRGTRSATHRSLLGLLVVGRAALTEPY